MKILPFLLLLCLVAPDAQANFRCQGKFIKGYSKVDVLRYCGEPILKDSYTKPGVIEHADQSINVNCEQVEQWHYIEGPNETSYIIEFERGVVTRIITGRDKP